MGTWSSPPLTLRMWGPKTGYTHALGASPLPNYFGCGACARKACAPHAFALFLASKSKKSMRIACFCAMLGVEKQEKHAHSRVFLFSVRFDQQAINAIFEGSRKRATPQRSSLRSPRKQVRAGEA